MNFIRTKLFRAASANRIALSSSDDISYSAVLSEDARGADILETCRSVKESCISLLGSSAAKSSSDETKGSKIYAKAATAIISTAFSPRNTENSSARIAKAGTDALLTLS